MELIDYLGILAQFFFIYATIGQTVAVLKQKHARGISRKMIVRLIIGFIIMIIYVPNKVGWNWLLLSGYTGQLICFSVIAKYSYFPKG